MPEPLGSRHQAGRPCCLTSPNLHLWEPIPGCSSYRAGAAQVCKDSCARSTVSGDDRRIKSHLHVAAPCADKPLANKLKDASQKHLVFLQSMRDHNRISTAAPPLGHVSMLLRDFMVSGLERSSKPLACRAPDTRRHPLWRSLLCQCFFGLVIRVALKHARTGRSEADLRECV